MRSMEMEMVWMCMIVLYVQYWDHYIPRMYSMVVVVDIKMRKE